MGITAPSIDQMLRVPRPPGLVKPAFRGQCEVASGSSGTPEPEIQGVEATGGSQASSPTSHDDPNTAGQTSPTSSTTSTSSATASSSLSSSAASGSSTTGTSTANPSVYGVSSANASSAQSISSWLLQWFVLCVTLCIGEDYLD